MMDTSQRAILELLQNYAQCKYPLSIGQIRSMLPVIISTAELKETINTMSQQRLISMSETQPWYTVRGHEIAFMRRRERSDISKAKRQILDMSVKLLCVCPWISAVVLTGSLALSNAKYSDDIDLMIITAPETMFLCRLYAFVLAKLLGLARKRSVETQPDALCINIWLDGSNLVVPSSKVNIYSAREIVNARVMIDKNNIFRSFIEANSWIHEKLPNWEFEAKSTEYPSTMLRTGAVQGTHPIRRRLNALVGSLQLWYMRPHKTHEIVSNTQLWFHPKIRYE